MSIRAVSTAVAVILLAATAHGYTHTTPPASKYGERGIFGKIFSAQKISGVTVEMKGPVTVTSTVSPNGYWGYSSTSFPAGTYTVRPIGEGLTLWPTSTTVVVWATPAGDWVINVTFSIISLPPGPGPAPRPPLPPLPDPEYQPTPEDDVLAIQKLKVGSKKWKLRATLRPGRGHGLAPEDGLRVFLDGLSALDVSADGGFVPKGSSGLKYIHRSEGLKVTMTLRAVDVRIKVKAKDPEVLERLLEIIGGEERTVSVLAGDFAASARK